MADHYSPDGEDLRTTRKPGGPPLGLDPVSPSRFGEIIDAEREGFDFDGPAQPNPYRGKRDQLSRATWVMIVVAGVFLGIAMAMIAAG